MAYSSTIKLVTNDSLPEMLLTLKNKNEAAVGQELDENDPNTWKPIDLIGATLKMYVREIDTTSILSTLTGIVLEAANGVAAFSFIGNEFTAAGVYEGEIEITFTNGVQTIYDLIKFKVRDDFD